MIRTLTVTIWVGFATLVAGILVIVLSFFVRSGNPLHKIARFWGRSILMVSRIMVSVKGLSNIDSSAPYTGSAGTSDGSVSMVGQGGTF
jgi:hypothetical protein